MYFTLRHQLFLGYLIIFAYAVSLHDTSQTWNKMFPSKNNSQSKTDKTTIQVIESVESLLKRRMR